MLVGIHHIGIAVARLDEGLRFWQAAFGLQPARIAAVAEQQVRAALLPTAGVEIELLEPLASEGPVGRFLARRGEGLHHLCFESTDIATDLAAAQACGLPLIDTAPRDGLPGKIAFIHPRGCHGVLVEYAQSARSEARHERAERGGDDGAAVSVVRVRIAAEDPQRAAGAFAACFGLQLAGGAGGPGARAEGGGEDVELTAPRGRLVFVSTAAATPRLGGRGAGLVAMGIEVADFARATRRLAPWRAGDSGPTGNRLVLDPGRCHGVAIEVSGR